VPVYHFSETHYLDATLVTEPYKATLFALTGRLALIRPATAPEPAGRSPAG
jgi:hypothetical protein